MTRQRTADVACCVRRRSRSRPAAGSAGHGEGENGDAGYSTVEAAITVPVFLLLLIGIIQFTLLWHGRNTAEAAAAEAANTARTYLGSAAAGQQAGQAFLQQVAPNLLKDATITVTRSATQVTVTITATVSSVVPFGQFSITETASAPVERFTPSQ